VVLALAAFLTIALNIDTLLIADRLSRDATLRELVVAAVAAKALEEKEKTAKGAAPGPDVNAAKQVVAELTQVAAEANQARAEAEAMRAEATRAREEAAIAGREAANEQAWPIDWVSRLTRVLGWLFTALAASLGAQFWFDVLGKVVNLRMSGKKPDKATE
jgi:hypothetical protein